MSHYSKNNSGFSIIELLVSLVIAGVILTVVVLNQATYTDRAAVTNLADEIGLTISQAQAYGVGVREFTAGSGEFGASYGLAFSRLSSGSDKAYLSFADRNGNEIYDGDWSCPVGGTSECLERSDIYRGNYIESLCVVRISGADICNNIGRIDISFARPNNEARLRFFMNNGQSFNPPNLKGAKIMLGSTVGWTKSVTVYLTGQVSVQ